MKTLAFIIVSVVAFMTPLHAQYSIYFHLDSLGVPDTEVLWGDSMVVYPNQIKEYRLRPCSIKILSGAAATVHLWEEYLIASDPTSANPVYDTLRAPAPFYDLDNELMVFTGQVAFNGANIRHIQLVDTSAWGTLRIFTEAALVPAIKVIVTW
ncbi:MAG: hypothetical protein RRA94_04010 [Bacteroidota bacterium]|nr:hypothetical protein [Bacteroidota bacterium]